MSSVPFAHLHFHSCYSLLDSTAKVKPTVQAAADMGMNYLAMTDHAVLFGAVEFYKTCLSGGLKPIIGCDMYVARKGVEVRESQRDNMSLVLLAETQEGYDNLVKIVSIAHLEGRYYKPRTDKALLRKYSKGLIALSGDPRGEVAEACKNDDIEEACKQAMEYSDIFGPGNFFIEIFDHGLDEEKLILKNLLEVSKRTGLPLVATNDVHYIRKEHAEAHDVLTCLQRSYLVPTQTATAITGEEYYLKSGEEMAALFPDQPQAISNTIEIAQRCNVEFVFLKKPRTSTFHSSRCRMDLKRTTTTSFILGKVGLKKLYGIDDLDHPKNEEEQVINTRFYYEVSVIVKTNYVNYFSWWRILFSGRDVRASRWGPAADRVRGRCWPIRWRSRRSSR